MPTTNTASESTASESVQAATSIAAASTTHAASRTRFSPNRCASAPAGRSPASWPMPMSPTTTAACATVAPRSSAESATRGRTAPMPIEMRMVGP